jgi:hypothetical protein
MMLNVGPSDDFDEAWVNWKEGWTKRNVGKAKTL